MYEKSEKINPKSTKSDKLVDYELMTNSPFFLKKEK